MQRISGSLMSGDRVIAEIENGNIIEYDENLLPLHLKRTKNFERWLASRAIDSHRTNSRLLKKVLRLKERDDVSTVLSVNAATITDRYWFRPEGSEETYDDIRFKENYFDKLALCGDPDSMSNRPSRTPELTNIGSFEKCWRLVEGKWWMYKTGNENEIFSELFICRLGEKLGLNMAHYELDDKYIRSEDFTDGAKVNYEPASSILGDDDDYERCFRILNSVSTKLAEQYLELIWTDTICFNMDRHTENFGFLRNVETGEILSLAPNYDNNIALISNGYPSDVSRKNDGLIGFFDSFVENCDDARVMYGEMNLPEITETLITQCMDEIPVKVDADYVREFIMNGYERIMEK